MELLYFCSFHLSGGLLARPAKSKNAVKIESGLPPPFFDIQSHAGIAMNKTIQLFAFVIVLAAGVVHAQQAEFELWF